MVRPLMMLTQLQQWLLKNVVGPDSTWFWTMAQGLAVTLTLILVYRQLILSSLTARAQFWLALRDQFSRHDKVHRKLRTGGEWAGKTGAPTTPEEWADLEAYMGLLEHCEAMLQDRLIDAATFRRIYEYRVENIIANPVIVEEKLRKRPEGWLLFHALLERLGLSISNKAA
jgi:hypothetical protein